MILFSLRCFSIHQRVDGGAVERRMKGEGDKLSPTHRFGRPYPTVEEINPASPRWRDYIHELASRTDKTGDVQTIAYLREDREALQSWWKSWRLKLQNYGLDYRSNPTRMELNDERDRCNP